MTKAAIIIAHPVDEVLWAGGTILKNPSWNWFIITLCGASDKDHCSRFKKASVTLRAQGTMCDLNDGPEQTPLDEKETQSRIMSVLPETPFDLILTMTQGKANTPVTDAMRKWERPSFNCGNWVK